jgi:hypothetical protein
MITDDRQVNKSTVCFYNYNYNLQCLPLEDFLDFLYNDLFGSGVF